MAKIISIALQKGGVGKTTTAHALASILGSMKNRVLLVDMDSQCNSTIISGTEEPQHTIVNVLTKECSISEAIEHRTYHDLLCADELLVNLERMDDIEPTLLKNILAAVQHDYDYIVIDTPPALGNLLQVSLMASDYVIIPAEPRPLSLKGLDALQATIEAVQAQNRALKVLGILLVRYNDRTVLNRQIREFLTDKAEQMGAAVFHTFIREGIAVPEAQAMQSSLIEYAPRSNPCIDYITFTNEILERIRA